MQNLTEKSFFYHAKCPRWISREVVYGKGLDALEELLIDDSMLPEVATGLLSARGEYVVVEDEDLDDAFSRTVELMKDGAATIYRGTLIDGHWVGRPDILERVEGKSELGSYYYVAVDVKRITDSRQIRESHRLQGAFYAELLERLQGTKPTSGYIMSPEGTVMRYDLEEFEVEYRLTLREIEDILSGVEDIHGLTSGCKASPYFDMCFDDTVECDDVSLLNRIRREEIAEFRRVGIDTVLQLASANVEELDRTVIEMSTERVRFLHRQAVAMKERVHDVVEAVEFRPSDVELYFDIEADPVRDIDYLFGITMVEKLEDGTTRDTHHVFVAESAEGERSAWDRFTAFLSEHRYAPVYHYGWYEIGVCAKLIERYGAPEGAIASWENNFIDLNSALRGNIIFPLPFYSLKDIAQYLGFKWRGEDVGGVNSIRWFHEWLDTGNRKVLDRIIEYNEDDVRATRFLKEWAEKQVPNSQ